MGDSQQQGLGTPGGHADDLPSPAWRAAWAGFASVLGVVGLFVVCSLGFVGRGFENRESKTCCCVECFWQ